MDQEGVDVHVIYGTLNLIFSSILDKDLYDRPVSITYNSYMADDCRGSIIANRLVYYLFKT